MTTLDPAVADLLLAVSDVLAGMDDRRAVAVRVAITRIYAGTGDPGVAADWLREFLAEREGAEAVKARMWPMGVTARERCEAAGPHTYKDCPNFRLREATHDART